MRITENNRPKEGGDEIKRFTPEAGQTLESLGYTITELSGKSFGEIYEEIRKRQFVDFSDTRQYEPIMSLAKPSMKSQVAIRPNNLYLEGGFGKSRSERESMLAKHLKMLQKKGVSEIKIVIGGLSDYLELIAKHYQNTLSDLLHDVYGEYTGSYIPGNLHVKSDIPGYKDIFVGHLALGRDALWISAVEDTTWWIDGAANIAPLIIPS